MNSDVEIAGDLLAVTHLLPPAPAHPHTVAGFAGLARGIAADRASWAHLVRYDATSRWYHRLRTGPGYEVWLLSWVPGQGSGTHDHGVSSGVLTVLEGELSERSEGSGGHTEPRGHGGRGGHREPGGRGTRGGNALTLRPGSQRVIAPGYVHEVSNDSLEPAVSLHVYFPGLTEMPMCGEQLDSGVKRTPAPASHPVGEKATKLTH